MHGLGDTEASIVYFTSNVTMVHFKDNIFIFESLSNFLTLKALSIPNISAIAFVGLVVGFNKARLHHIEAVILTFCSKTTLDFHSEILLPVLFFLFVHHQHTIFS